MRQIDEAYTQSPFYGSRRITVQLNRQYGQQWNRKRIQRLMHLMGIRGVAPGQIPVNRILGTGSIRIFSGV